jgi:hypothetical protein
MPRGALKGNTNARKHGFYSRRFPAREAQDAAAHHFEGLTEEIQLMRFYIRRLAEAGGEARDFYDLVEVTRALSQAITALTRLIHLQQSLSPNGGDELLTIFQSAIDTVYAEHRAARPATDPPLPADSPTSPAAP